MHRLAGFFLLISTAVVVHGSEQTPSGTSGPHIERHGTTAHLVVDGRPFFNPRRRVA